MKIKIAIMLVSTVSLFANDLNSSINFSINNYTQHLESSLEENNGSTLSNVSFDLSIKHKLKNDISLQIALISAEPLGSKDEIYNSFYETRSTLLKEANFTYQHSPESTFTVGRQQITRTMINDYYEGAFWQYKNNSFNSFLSILNKSAVFDPDKITNYKEIDDDNLSYGIEIQKQFGGNITIEGFYYHISSNQLLNGGATRLFSNSLNIEYYANSGNSKGQVLSFFVEKETSQLTTRLGYIRNNHLDGSFFLNDPWNPFEENLANITDAEIGYITFNYQCTPKVTIQSVYGYANLKEEDNQEFNLIINYQVKENLEFTILYAGWGKFIGQTSKISVEFSHSF